MSFFLSLGDSGSFSEIYLFCHMQFQQNNFGFRVLVGCNIHTVWSAHLFFVWFYSFLEYDHFFAVYCLLNLTVVCKVAYISTFIESRIFIASYGCVARLITGLTNRYRLSNIDKREMTLYCCVLCFYAHNRRKTIGGSPQQMVTVWPGFLHSFPVCLFYCIIGI